MLVPGVQLVASQLFYKLIKHLERCKDPNETWSNIILSTHLDTKYSLKY